MAAQPSANTKLLMFGSRPTQMAIQKTTKMRINPKHPIESYPIVFEINSCDGFIDWDKTLIAFYFNLTKKDGTAIDAAKRATTINYVGNTFINRFKFYASNNLIFDSLDCYSYLSYLQAVLFEEKQVKDTLLVSALYYEDTPGKEATSNENAGFKNRYAKTKSGKFKTIAPLHGDIFSSNQYFPRMCDYRLELFRNTDDFLLLSTDEDCTLQLTQAELLLHIVHALPSFTLAYEKTLAKTPAQYNIKRTEIKILHLAAGRTDLPNTCVHCGVIPRRVVLMMIPSVDFYGRKSTSPFNFKAHTLQRYQLRANEKLFPSEPIDTDFENGNASEAYRELFDSVAGNTHICSITYEQFLNGYSFFITDLSPDSSGSAGRLEKNTGFLSFTFFNFSSCAAHRTGQSFCRTSLQNTDPCRHTRTEASVLPRMGRCVVLQPESSFYSWKSCPLIL